MNILKTAQFVVNLGPQPYSVQFFVLLPVLGDVWISSRFYTIERCCCVVISFKSEGKFPITVGAITGNSLEGPNQGRPVIDWCDLSLLLRPIIIFLIQSTNLFILSPTLSPKMMSVWRSNAQSLLLTSTTMVSMGKTNTLHDALSIRASLWRRGMDTMKH